MTFKHSILLFLSFCSGALNAQSMVEDSSNRSKTLHAEVAVEATSTSNSRVPFWMRSNRYGSIPLAGVSGAVTGRVSKAYINDEKRRLFDWGGAADIRLNTGREIQFIPVEAYLKGRIGIFQLKAGRSRDRSGLADSTLSSGSYTISGNALGIPKIEFSVPEFWSVPFLGNIVAFKGAFSHGWMGRVGIQYGDFDGQTVKSYFHNSSFYGRFGKPTWRLKLLAGINHEVIWGSDKLIFADQYNLSNLDAFWHVITGKKYVKHGVQRDISKIGNHLGSIDLGLEYETSSVRVFAYRQHFYDKGALAYLANIKDGLNGISITNKSKTNTVWNWDKFLVEVFFSKNQAGEANAKKTPSGPEYYYNHAVYSEGYSYKGLGIGNPLITAASDARNNLPNAPFDYFINNRVIAYHVGNQGTISKWHYTIKLTYSNNYGEYRTTDIPYYFNGKRRERAPIYGIFPKVNQFSGFAEIFRPLPNGLNIGAMLAYDQGKLLYNSMGGSLRVSKTW